MGRGMGAFYVKKKHIPTNVEDHTEKKEVRS